MFHWQKQKNNFIADASMIWSISSNADGQYRNGTIASKKYKDTMVHYFYKVIPHLLQNEELNLFLLTYAQQLMM